MRTWEGAAPDPAVEDAVLLGSELVANAVQHAGTGVEAGCRVVAGAVEVAVTDPGAPRYRRITRASHPASSVSTADTQKDMIDADIQAAGVKPMSCPKDVHAEAHQDTYPGLMSW